MDGDRIIEAPGGSLTNVPGRTEIGIDG